MYSLTYVSSATRPLTQIELRELLMVCEQNNRREGITGMLLYKDGNFMQVLEGEEPDVRLLYTKIGKDPRHRGILVLIEENLDGREFPDWSMGFRDLSAGTQKALPGYSPFLSAPLTAGEFSTDVSRARQLLLTFKNSIRG